MDRTAGRQPRSGSGYVLEPGQSVPTDPDTQGIKASAASTGGSLTLIESRLDGGPPRHVHTHEDESFYVLDGSLTVYCGNDEFQAGPGSFVFLPRGVPHHFTTSAGSATVLIIATPGGIEAYFREISAAPDEPSRQQVRTKYGILRADTGQEIRNPEPRNTA